MGGCGCWARDSVSVVENTATLRNQLLNRIRLLDYTRDRQKERLFVQALGTTAMRGFRGLREGFRGSLWGTALEGQPGSWSLRHLHTLVRKQSGCRSKSGVYLIDEKRERLRHRFGPLFKP